MKDKKITRLIKYLQAKFGQNEILLVDFWDSDNCAIGLTDKTEKYLIYISVYKRKPNKFFISLENMQISEGLHSKEYNNIKLSDLEIQLISHFNL